MLAPVPPLSPDSLVVAALSGGVDSAVAAAELVAAGHRVVGMTMRLAEGDPTVATTARGRCCGPRDADDARRVCDHLGIPFYVIDLAAEFRAHVMEDFVDAYLAGETPNPCVRCNQHIKFTPLLARAKEIGATALVTGHYAQIDQVDGEPALRRGVDAGKDQSYFLYSMPAQALAEVRFPLGAWHKHEVRAKALAYGLPNAQKPESQEVCFIPDGDTAGFVRASALRRGRVLPSQGPIVDQAGQVIGQHAGAHGFTVGQHRGLGNLRGVGSERMFVTAIDVARDTVTVGPLEAASRTQFTAAPMHWLTARPRVTFAAEVAVRYRGAPIPAQITVKGDRAHIELSQPSVIAAGQSAVIYDGDRVLGGGWIERAPVSA